MTASEILLTRCANNLDTDAIVCIRLRVAVINQIRARRSPGAYRDR